MVGQAPKMSLPALLEGYKAGPVFHGQNANPKTTLIPLNPSLDYQPDFPLQHPGVDLSSEVEEYN